MKIYFERTISCDCGDALRQTATELPLNRVGKLLDRMQRRDFILEHRFCNSCIRYTTWKLGLASFLGKYYERKTKNGFG